MSSKTTNYNLHKIDLNDSPPDITVLNQNFDILDEKLKEAMESGGCTPDEIGALALDGSNSMIGQLHTPKVFFDRSNGVYGDGGIYKANQSSNASTQIMDRGSNNKFAILALNGQTQGLSLTFGVQNADGTSETTAVHQVYHEGNMPTPTDIGALPLTGGTLSGVLKHDMSNGVRGEGRFYKNNTSSDNGTKIEDHDANGNYVSLMLHGRNQNIKLTKKLASGDAKSGVLYGEHNKPTGTYTGNGLSQKRTVNLGDTFGHTVWITGANGHSVLAGQRGAIGFKNESGASVKTFKNNEINFSGGILTITTSSEYINASGVEYIYDVL